MGVTLGKTADARNVGVSAGENGLARKDGCSPDEYIECNIIGLLLYTWLLAGGALRPYECNIVLLIYLYDWRKCYFSGGTLQGSGSPLNHIKHYRCCVYQLIRNP